MMSIVGQYAPRQQIYSIDECFLDFDGVRGDLAEIGRDIRQTVLQWTGLPTSVGFGPTKTLAKLANHVAKTAERKPGSYPAEFAQVCNFGVMSRAELDALMDATEVGCVWGVGRRIGARLTEAGIHTVRDLVNADITALRSQFSVVLEKTLLELRGTSCLDLDDTSAGRQQIMCSRSFGGAVTELSELEQVVGDFASRVAEKLRQQGSAAGAVHVFITTSPHRKHDRQHSPSMTVPMVRPTTDTRELVVTATRALKRMYRPGFNYVKAGVMLVDLHDGGARQGELDLFTADEPTTQAEVARDRSQLMGALDALNHRFGKGAVRIASAQQGRGMHASVGKQERRTPRYTTRLDEVVRVNS
jgi:DNA polymerase V